MRDGHKHLAVWRFLQHTHSDLTSHANGWEEKRKVKSNRKKHKKTDGKADELQGKRHNNEKKGRQQYFISSLRKSAKTFTLIASFSWHTPPSPIAHSPDNGTKCCLKMVNTRNTKQHTVIELMVVRAGSVWFKEGKNKVPRRMTFVCCNNWTILI